MCGPFQVLAGLSVRVLWGKCEESPCWDGLRACSHLFNLEMFWTHDRRSIPRQSIEYVMPQFFPAFARNALPLRPPRFMVEMQTTDTPILLIVHSDTLRSPYLAFSLPSTSSRLLPRPRPRRSERVQLCRQHLGDGCTLLEHTRYCCDFTDTGCTSLFSTPGRHTC